ncbi:MAG TPA: hypothetical protein VJN91_03175 [Gammaproteobacteria bacterium]|nr:hypothetical protein [Gammaproteobacteria bacterium]
MKYIREIRTGLCGILAFLFSFGAFAQTGKLTVLNPLGQPPAIARIPMAPRLDTLDGKTIYIVDIGFTDTHQLLTEMRDLLKSRYPKAAFEVRKKAGVYYEDDPQLWAEIKERGHGMIIAVGH